MKFLIRAKRVTDNSELGSNLKTSNLEDLLDTQLQSLTPTLQVVRSLKRKLKLLHKNFK